MLSPVGLPPQAPVPPDGDLVPALERSIVLPKAGAGAGTWQAGSMLSATVRLQNDEMLLKVGDRFFTTRPIPGVSENSNLTLQVARDPTGSLMLVPMLPLAGKAAARIAGAPPVVRDMTIALASAPQVMAATKASAVVTPIAPRPPPISTGAVQTLAQRLEPPRSLADWLMQSMASVQGSASTETATISRGVAGWVQALTIALSQSGLFYEAKLKARKPVPPIDLKRQLLNFIDMQPRTAGAHSAWAALDELVGMQSAANLAHQAGGCCYSFVLPAPDGLGAWWIIFQQDPRRLRDEGGNGGRDSDEREPPWRIRLSGIELPGGRIDIRLEQVGESGVAVTLTTPQADRTTHWEAARAELARRFAEAGLELARWSVLDPAADKSIPAAVPGQLRTVSV